MLRVAVVARDHFWNDAVSQLIAQQSDLAVSATLIAPTLNEAVGFVQTQPCDVVIIHHDLGRVSGLDLVRELSVPVPDLPLVVVGLPEHEITLTPYFEYGVLGYVQEQDAFDHLLDVIRAAGQGESLIPPPVAAALLDRLTELSHDLGSVAPVSTTDNALTLREQQVLQLIADGQSNQQIAKNLFIEVGTVKNHVHRILRKLGVSDRQQAARYLLRADSPVAPTGMDE